MNLHDTDAAEALVHLANRQETDVQQQSESGIGPNSTSLSTSGSLGSPSLATEQQQRRMDSNSQQSGNNNSPGFSQASSPEMAQILVTMTEMMRQNTMLVESMNRNQAGNPFQYNVLPDLSHNIAKFDGLSGAADARVWLKQLESTAMLHRWTEAIAFETARSHLTRAARNWYLANVDTVINWQSFKTAFSNAFLMDKTMTEKWQDMVKRNQGSGEDTREFFFDKVRLCKLLQLDVEETKKQIAIGLWSKETSSAIMSRNHYDIDELLRNIVEIEATEMARKQRIAAQRDYTKSTSTDWRRGGKEQKTATEVSATSQPYTNSNASGSRPVIECYRCAIFHNGCEEDKAVFEYAIEHIRMNRLAGQLVLESIIKWVPFETDSIGTTAAVCDLLAEGVAGIIGPRSEYTMPIVGSITARYDIPHIEYSWRSIEESELPSTTINVYPASSSISEAIKQLTAAMSWTQFTAIYETDDGLSRIQEALKLHGPKDNPVTVRQLGEGSDHRPLLKDIASSREPNIILDAESEQITDILRQANQVGLMQNYHTYIIWDLDFPGHSIVENFMNSTVNMTGFGLLTEKRNELKAGLGLQALKVESALLYDAVLLFNLALQSLYMVNAEIDEPLDLIPVPLSCDLEEKYTAGRNLTEAIRSEKRLNETTGPMKIDENGLRQAFDLQVYEFRLDSLIRVGVFNEDGLNITRSDAEREKDIAKKIKTTRYRVTTRLGPPYLIEVTDGSNRGVEIGNKRYEGYSVDLIAAVAEIRNFEYVFELVPDGNYGSYNEVNKSWNGLVKRLQDRQADLAICDLTINHQREGAVDFTMPFMNLGISILFMKPPVQETNLFSFLSPFTNEVWVYVATAYLAVSVMLFLLARIAPAEWDNPHPCNPDPEELENTFNLMNSMWLTIGSLMQQGSDLLPKAPSIRMIAGLWWFFVLIMVSSYTANLAAFLTSGKMGNTISNAEDLAAQTKIKFGALEGGSTSMFFKDSNDSTYQRMWAAMNEAKPSVFTKSNDEGVERVLSGKRAYAFIMESTAIEYHVERNCELQQIGQQLDSKGYGIAMPLNSPHRTLINRAVLTLQEQGKLERLKNKWWKEQNIVKPCEPDETLDDTEQLKLRLENVGGMFLVLGCGCAASFIVGILEFLWNVRKVAVNEKITPWEALVAEFKFAINIWVRTKPVKVAQSASRSSSSAPVAGEIRRGTSVARSIVGSFLRLDMLDKFEKDNTSNNKNGNQKSN